MIGCGLVGAGIVGAYVDRSKRFTETVKVLFVIGTVMMLVVCNGLCMNGAIPYHTIPSLI